MSVEYNPKDPNILAGGCYNGQVIAIKQIIEIKFSSLWLITQMVFMILTLNKMTEIHRYAGGIAEKVEPLRE